MVLLDATRNPFALRFNWSDPSSERLEDMLDVAWSCPYWNVPITFHFLPGISKTSLAIPFPCRLVQQISKISCQAAGWRPCLTSCGELSIKASNRKQLVATHCNNATTFVSTCMVLLDATRNPFAFRFNWSDPSSERLEDMLDVAWSCPYWNFPITVHFLPGISKTSLAIPFPCRLVQQISKISCQAAGWRPCLTSCGELSIRASNRKQLVATHCNNATMQQHSCPRAWCSLMLLAIPLHFALIDLIHRVSVLIETFQ